MIKSIEDIAVVLRSVTSVTSRLKNSRVQRSENSKSMFNDAAHRILDFHCRGPKISLCSLGISGSQTKMSFSNDFLSMRKVRHCSEVSERDFEGV